MKKIEKDKKSGYILIGVLIIIFGIFTLNSSKVAGKSTKLPPMVFVYSALCPLPMA